MKTKFLGIVSLLSIVAIATLSSCEDKSTTTYRYNITNGVIGDVNAVVTSQYVLDLLTQRELNVTASESSEGRQQADEQAMQMFNGQLELINEADVLSRLNPGDTVSLQDVIDEAIARATKVVEEKSPDMPEDEKSHVAQIVGIGAIKFAELSQNRLSDYIFDWDKMLALTGDTAPYLQNSYVRVRSIFRKIDGEFKAPASLTLSEDAEIHLARLLVRYAEVVPSTLDDCKPNLLAAYLYELARAFHSFYEACPVLRSEGDVRESRLALCELTARVLKQGMGLLGIEMPDRM